MKKSFSTSNLDNYKLSLSISPLLGIGICSKKGKDSGQLFVITIHISKATDVTNNNFFLE
jgi:hypothetical protein